MTLAFALAIANVGGAAIALFSAWALAKSPGFGFLRWFLALAATAVVYSAVDAAIVLPAGAAYGSVLTRINTLIGALHSAVWPFYAAGHLGKRVHRVELGLSALAVVTGALALVPGVVFEREPHPLDVPWAGVRYLVPAPTELGKALLPLLLLPMIATLVAFTRSARAGVASARIYVAAFAAYLACTLNEVLVIERVYVSVFLSDLAFFLVLAAAAFDVARRAAETANNLDTLSTNLGTLVGKRTEELAQMREALVRTERLAVMGQMAAAVGHEINNPLTYVMGNLEVLEQATAETASEDVKESLRDAKHGAVRIQRIVSDLRAYVRAPSDDGEATSNVSEAVASAVRTTQAILKNHATVLVDTGDVHVALEPSRLGQVLVNLITNAAHALHEAGRQGTGKIRISARRSGGVVRVTVSDDGVGMNAETQARVFEPFFTTRAATTGTGLGLFVTAGIVRAASGEITVESTPGEGTHVHLDLPLARHGPRGAMASSPEAPPVAARAAGVPTVLIVDDDEFVARGMKRLLHAYDVVCVPTVDAALGVLETSSDFDAVVCDLMMPLQTGVDLYAHAQARWPELAARFLFVTGGATTGVTAAFLAEHQDRVVYKPVDGKVLRRRVAEVSGGRPPTAR